MKLVFQSCHGQSLAFSLVVWTNKGSKKGSGHVTEEKHTENGGAP